LIQLLSWQKEPLENLHAKMQEINGERRLVRQPPSMEMVKEWVAQAKELPRVVEY
jgi:hypothetical protein